MVTKKSMESNRSPLSGSKNANFYVFNLLFTCPLLFALTTAGTAGEITFNPSDQLFARPMQISPLTTTALQRVKRYCPNDFNGDHSFNVLTFPNPSICWQQHVNMYVNISLCHFES